MTAGLWPPGDSTDSGSSGQQATEPHDCEWCQLDSLAGGVSDDPGS